MAVVTSVLAELGSLASHVAVYVQRHPRVLLFLGTAGLGGVMGWMVVTLALLLNPMRGLYVMLYFVLVSTAVMALDRDRALSLRLWVAMLASVMGLLSFRVIYWDLLHLDLDQVFRSNLIGIFGLVCGVTGFLKVR